MASIGTTVNCPSNIRFRDFSTLTAYSGNPIIPNGVNAYDFRVVDTPYITAGNKIAGNYYTLGDAVPAGGSNTDYNTFTAYVGSTQLVG